MLTNPYKNPINSSNPTGLRLQVDIDPADKHLITTINSNKGTLQLVVNNLIFNLCNDLRELNIHGYIPDGSTILEILTNPRPITDDQFQRLQQSSIGTIGPISSRLFDSGRGTSVCKTPTTTPEGSDYAESRTPEGKRRTGTKDAKKNKENKSNKG